MLLVPDLHPINCRELGMVKAGQISSVSFARVVLLPMQKLADLGDVVIQNDVWITMSPKSVSFFLVFCSGTTPVRDTLDVCVGNGVGGN
jgi:hypothetical protein